MEKERGKPVVFEVWRRVRANDCLTLRDLPD